MRTTITLDDDVAAKLEAERRKSGRSLRETANHFLRLGLTSKRPRSRKPFVVRDAGFRLGMDFQSAAELIEYFESPHHR